MNVLVTGGAGFIGSNLVEYFNREAPLTQIRVLDDFSTGKVANLEGLDADIVKGDIADRRVVDAAMSGVDAVVHLGALGSVPRSVKDPVRSHEVNVNGTVNVLEAARRANAYVVYASSSSVYGANPKLPKNERDWTRPMSPYAVNKLAGEAYVIAYQTAYNLQSLAFRFFNVFGPRQAADHDYAAVIPTFLHAALQGQPLPVHGDGQQSRDFTYVETVCETLYSAVTRRVVSPDPVNLAFGTNTTLLELIEAIKKVSDLEISVDHNEPRVGDVRASQAEAKRLMNLFPDTAGVPLEDGIVRTLDWFRSSGTY